MQATVLDLFRRWASRAPHKHVVLPREYDLHWSVYSVNATTKQDEGAADCVQDTFVCVIVRAVT